MSMGCRVVAAGRNTARLEALSAIYEKTGRFKTVVLSGHAQVDSAAMIRSLKLGSMLYREREMPAVRWAAARWRAVLPLMSLAATSASALNNRRERRRLEIVTAISVGSIGCGTVFEMSPSDQRHPAYHSFSRCTFSSPSRR
jgi:hypothetical protein